MHMGDASINPTNKAHLFHGGRQIYGPFVFYAKQDVSFFGVTPNVA